MEGGSHGLSEYSIGFMKRILQLGILLPVVFAGSGYDQAGAADYATISSLFENRCTRCHSAKEPDGELVLESYPRLMKGGESGKVIAPGKSDKSLLVHMIEGRKGVRAMPPGRNRSRLKPDEIKLIRDWIDAGAKPPMGGKSKLQSPNSK